MKARWALALLLLTAAPAQAAINGPQAFEADYGFMEGLNGDAFTVVSGAAEVHLPHAAGAFGFFETSGFEVDGLERVCWIDGQPQCAEGALALRVRPGGSAAIDFPGTVEADYVAAHALGLFVDFEGDEDLNSYGIGETLLAPAVDGLVTFGKVQGIPFSSLFDLDAMGGLAGLDGATRIDLVQDGAVARTFEGKDAQVSFSGAPEVSPFRSDLVALPFETGAQVTFAPATSEAAQEGLRLSRIDELLADLDASNAGAGGTVQGNATQDLGDVESVLAEVLNGALLRVPTQNGSIEQTFAVIRFDELQVTGSGDALAWGGHGALALQEGEVAGAPDLVGVGFFALPLWSIILWVVALGVWIARLLVKPPKEHAVWDRYKWVGWVFGALAFIVLFVLWDLEVRAVWGTSLFSTDARGTGLLVTLAVQIAPLMFVLFAAAAPIRMLLRNTLLLSRQGTFMGLSGGVAYLLAYALGATLLLAYIELVITQVMETLGG